MTRMMYSSCLFIKYVFIRQILVLIRHLNQNRVKLELVISDQRLALCDQRSVTNKTS